MNLEMTELPIAGAFSLKMTKIGDARGSFLKLYNQNAIGEILPHFIPREAYITRSCQGVLRGMHFQLPPTDHAKIAIILSGRVNDVLLDLRAGSGYGTFTSLDLLPSEINAVIIPKGVAHGFYAYEDNSTLLYLVETVHSPCNDKGISWDSFGYQWPSNDPILSMRDMKHPKLIDFTTPNEWSKKDFSLIKENKTL